MRSIRLLTWLVAGMLLANFLVNPAVSGWAQASKGSEVAVGDTVNLNKATVEELQAVRGIGPSLAERIVDYREANGKFESLDELIEVRGIGEKKLEKIKSRITL